MLVRITTLFLIIIASAFVLTLWIKSPQMNEPLIVAENSSAEKANSEQASSLEIHDTQATHKGSSVSNEAMTVIEEPLSEQFAEVAMRFEEAIQYPSESLPIFDPIAVTKYQSNLAAPIRYEQDNITLTLHSDHLRYRPEQPITGQVTVDISNSVNVDLSLIQQGQVIASMTLMTNELGHAFELPALGQSWQTDEIQLVARYRSGNNEWVISTPIHRIQTHPFSARMQGVESSYVDGAWLKIPIALNIQSQGFYRLEANLYSATDNRPLLHLTAEDKLAPGSQTLVLRAHISALKAMLDEGDYVLKNIALEQMPSAPNFETHPGVVEHTSIPVTGFPFSAYRDEAYQDEEAMARLEFLQTLSSP